MEAEAQAGLAAAVQQGALAPLLHFNNYLESVSDSAAPCERVAASP